MTKLLISKNATLENIMVLYERGFEFIIENGIITYAFRKEN